MLINKDTGLESHALECIKDPSIMKTHVVASRDPLKLLRRSSNEELDLGWMVSQNFQEVRSVYSSAAAYPAAVAYWVNKVKPHGDWDYKAQPGFEGNKTFWCKFGPNDSSRGNYNGEWIGNYNYGYTGHLLFDINVLLAGSSAVGGGPEKDKHDWPAIKSGYNHSGKIEW